MNLTALYIGVTDYFREMNYIVLPSDLKEWQLEAMAGGSLRAGLRFIGEARSDCGRIYSTEVPEGLLGAKIFVDAYVRCCGAGLRRHVSQGGLPDALAERRFIQYRYMLLVTKELGEAGRPLPEVNLLGFDRYERSVIKCWECARSSRHTPMLFTLPFPAGYRCARWEEF